MVVKEKYTVVKLTIVYFFASIAEKFYKFLRAT